MKIRGKNRRCYLVSVARELRKGETKAEKIVWSLLRNRGLCGLKFRRQHQLGPFIVDFYCDELKLIIELDGEVHQDINQKERDLLRDNSLKSMGLTVLRFKNHEVLGNPELFLTKIEAFASQPPSPYL